jgi:hypothetical protein
LLRLLLSLLSGLLAVFLGLASILWFLGGGPGRLLRDESPDGVRPALAALARALELDVAAVHRWISAHGASLTAVLVVSGTCTLAIAGSRWLARSRRRYVRLRIDVYRTDHAAPDAVAGMFEALHKRLLRRWWRRLLLGQPSLALEVHLDSPGQGAPHSAWLALSCPRGLERMVQSALQGTYPNCRLRPTRWQPDTPATVLRLKKRAQFTERVKQLEFFEREDVSSMDRLLTLMGACGETAFVQFALTPTPACFETLAKRLYKHHEAHLSRERREHLVMRDRSMVEDTELRGGLDVQHKPLFFADLRVIAPDRTTCERIASELRAHGAENRLIERGTAVRHGVFRLYARRVLRGEGNPIPSFDRGVFASTELAALWGLPSSDYETVPFARTAVPFAPAPPGILRPTSGAGLLRDAIGPVSIDPQMCAQNVAVSGAAQQGKSSFLVATVAEDLRRERCAVIVLDPKGDLAEAAVSVVPPERTCTLLDLEHAAGVDFDRVIAGCEVLVVKGTPGAVGALDTSGAIQLLMGLLDAALARRRDLPVGERVAVALKIDEAPTVLNRGFAETIALNRSAGLETVACWQTDAQWVERDVRNQLDALFAHRVYFATTSVPDARSAANLTMAEYSDMVRPGIARLSTLGHPDVRLHLPRHHAIVSWTTAAGRQAPFIAQTNPLRIDRERLASHAARRHERATPRPLDPSPRTPSS